MNTTTTNSLHQASLSTDNAQENMTDTDTTALSELLKQELIQKLGSLPSSALTVINRIVVEVSRICSKSDRIQKGGDIHSWQLTLARHRLSKCIEYYNLGSKQGRVELHSHLSVMIYRQVAPTQAQLNFAARRNLIEDFLQDFYVDSLRAFRREQQLADNYTPRTRIELAEYMAFTEQYAKRRVTTGYGAVQLLVLRAKSFANARTSHWQLVHQWLGADLDQKLGLSTEQWDTFVSQLDSKQQQLLSLKRANSSDFEIVKAMKITPKQVQKRWSELLEMASLVRNNALESANHGINHSMAA